MSKVVNLTDETNTSEMEGVTLIDFWAPWCGPCRTLSPLIEELAEEFDGKVVIAKINVDENAKLTAMFKIRGIPAVFILKDGEVVEKLVGGGKSKADYTAYINKHLKE